uniref:Peptidase S1 domain-containing protein n=1 Tax=Chelydra serpentina TaxID=8475 RepID=A0A8C3XT11_CHESE
MEQIIVGGHEAKPHSRPYMAYLQRTTLGDFCGGFLVAQDWVMTAAHCRGNLTVTLGAHNIHKQEDSQQRFAVQSYHPHPDYKEHSKAHDILLLKLKGNAQLNKYVNVIHLPRANSNIAPGSQCSTAGWGRIDHGKATSKLFETNRLLLVIWELALFQLQSASFWTASRLPLAPCPSRTPVLLSSGFCPQQYPLTLGLPSQGNPQPSNPTLPQWLLPVII